MKFHIGGDRSFGLPSGGRSHIIHGPASMVADREMRRQPAHSWTRIRVLSDLENTGFTMDSVFYPDFYPRLRP